MNTLTVEGWCKKPGDAKSTALGEIHFYVSEADHVRLEQAEERLQKNHESEMMVDADMTTLQLQIPEQYGPLADCQWRVYLSARDQRGQFHLVGHRAGDGSLVYSNSIMIDQLG